METAEITTSKLDLTIEDMVQIVRGWPQTRRMRFLRRVVEIMDDEPSEHQPETENSASLSHIWSLLPQNMPQVSDEELDRMKLEWRMEKHG